MGGNLDFYKAPRACSQTDTVALTSNLELRLRARQETSDKKRKSAKSTPKPKSASGGATVAPEKLLKIKLKDLHSTWNLRKHADACVSARATLDDSDQNKEVRSNLKQRAALARSKSLGIEDEDLSSD